MSCCTKKSILHLTCLISLCLPAISSSGGELGDLLRASLDNPSVTSAQFQSDAAKAQVDAAKGRLYGQAMLHYGRHYYDAQRVVGYYAPGTLPAPLLSSTIDQGGVAYILPIDVFGQISASVDKANGEALAANLVYRRQTLAKLHQATGAYYMLYVLEKRRAALAVYRHFVEAVVGRLKKETEFGRAAEVDSSYAESQLAKLQSDEAVLAGDIASTQASLAVAGSTFRLHAQRHRADHSYSQIPVAWSGSGSARRASGCAAADAIHHLRNPRR